LDTKNDFPIFETILVTSMPVSNSSVSMNGYPHQDMGLSTTGYNSLHRALATPALIEFEDLRFYIVDCPTESTLSIYLQASKQTLLVESSGKK
jgi:hypothetical protein